MRVIDLGKVLNPMIEYTTFDEQTRNYSKRIYKKESFEEGKKEGFKEGFEEGFEKGFEEGFLIGEKIKALKLFEKLIKAGFSEEKAYELVSEP